MVSDQNCEQKSKVDKFFTLIYTCVSVHVHRGIFSFYLRSLDLEYVSITDYKKKNCRIHTFLPSESTL